MTPTKKYLIIAAIVLLLLISKKVSAEKLIAKFEGIVRDKKNPKRIISYRDTANVWTIGFGNTKNPYTGEKIKEGDVIDEKTALDWLKKDIEQRQTAIRKLVKVPITSNQMTAITSLAYNIGLTAFQRSKLLEKLNQKRPIQEVADEFLKYNKFTKNGVKTFSQGLMNRRIEERKIFLS